MDYREPKETPEPAYEEQPKAMEGIIEFSSSVGNDAMTSTIAAMASAMSNLMEPDDAAAINEAAAKLTEGVSDGDA